MALVRFFFGDPDEIRAQNYWNLACSEDGIDPNSSFVTFSKTNKWAKKYNRIRCRLAKKARST